MAPARLSSAESSPEREASAPGGKGGKGGVLRHRQDGACHSDVLRPPLQHRTPRGVGLGVDAPLQPVAPLLQGLERALRGCCVVGGARWRVQRRNLARGGAAQEGALRQVAWRLYRVARQEGGLVTAVTGRTLALLAGGSVQRQPVGRKRAAAVRACHARRLSRRCFQGERGLRTWRRDVDVCRPVSTVAGQRRGSGAGVARWLQLELERGRAAAPGL